MTRHSLGDESAEFSDARQRRRPVRAGGGGFHNSSGTHVTASSVSQIIPSRSPLVPPLQTHNLGSGHRGRVRSTMSAVATAGPLPQLVQWLDSHHDVVSIDYVDVLLHFVRIDSSRTDVVSLIHVLIGAAQLVFAIQMVPSTLPPVSSGGAAGVRCAASGGASNPLVPVPHAAARSTGSSALEKQPAADEMFYIEDNHHMSCNVADNRHSGHTYAARVMLFELQTLGAALCRCDPLVNMSPTAAALVNDLNNAALQNVHRIAEAIPVVYGQLLQLIAPGGALVAESMSANSSSAVVDMAARSPPQTKGTASEAHTTAAAVEVPRHIIPKTGKLPPFVTLSIRHRDSQLGVHTAVDALHLVGMCTLMTLAGVYDGRWEVELPLAFALLIHSTGWYVRYHSPLIGISLKVTASASLSVAYAVHTILFDSTDMDNFPFWIVACLAALFYACRLTDVATLRVMGNTFQSAYLVDDLLSHYDDDSSDDDDTPRANGRGDSAGGSEVDDEEDDNEYGDESPDTERRAPPRTQQGKSTSALVSQRKLHREMLEAQYAIEHISPLVVRVVFPCVLFVIVAGSFAARLIYLAPFRQAGSIAGEVLVTFLIVAVYFHHYYTAQIRRLAEEDALRLAYGIIRSTIDELRQIVARASSPRERASPSSVIAARVRATSSNNDDVDTSLSPEAEQNYSNDDDGASIPVVLPTAPAGGPMSRHQRPSQRVVADVDDDDFSPSIYELLDGPRMATSSGHRSKSPAVLRGGAGRPRQSNTLVKEMSSSTGTEGGPASTAHIMLAGKTIAPHGEMLISLPPSAATGKFPAVCNAGGPTGYIWRTPLDEIHLTTIVIAVDGRGDIVFWNWFAEDLTQFAAEDVMGRNILSILPSAAVHAEMFSKISMTMSDRSTSTTKCSIVSRRVGKPTIEVALQAYPAKVLQGTTVGVILAGSPIRHETFQDVANQLLDIHSSMPDIPSRPQLYQALLLLQSELPKSTAEVSLPQFLGRIFSSQFQKKAVLLDVVPNFPSTITIDVDALQLVVLEMLQHYMRAGNGCVNIQLDHDEVAQVVILRAIVDVAAFAHSGMKDRRFSTATGDASTTCDVPPWKPSVTVAQAARKLNCIIRTATTAVAAAAAHSSAASSSAHCTLTIVGATSANQLIETRDGDHVRCNVAIFDTETLSSILIRNAVWERKHMLFFIEDAKKLSVALDGVDILFARFPRALVEKAVLEIKQERPLLEVVVIASDDSSDRTALLATNKNIPCIILEDPILSSEIQDALTAKVQAITDRRLREDKVSDIRKLFSQAKSCPWVRGRLLGRGATAIVYEATNTITSGKMAVRTIRINSLEAEQLKSTMESLIAEVKLMARLEHKNIINYLSLERDAESINVFLEYAPGGSIRSILDKRGRVSIDQTAMWLRDILEGLSYLHGEGVVHLDLKCANILVAADGTCKISDFGTARDIGAMHESVLRSGVTNADDGRDRGGSISQGITTSSTHTTESTSKESNASGTLHFMSPEMLNGGLIDWRSDIWSLGCTAMEMITGKLPFSHMGALAIVGYVSSLAANDTVDLPGDVRDINAISFIHACLCVDPAGRPNARTLQNHPFIVQQSGRQLTMPRPAQHPKGHRETPPAMESDDDDSARRESCFSTWSTQDQVHERRRATAAEW